MCVERTYRNVTSHMKMLSKHIYLSKQNHIYVEKKDSNKQKITRRKVHPFCSNKKFF